LAQTIRDVEQLNVELENPAFRRTFILALRAIRRHGAIRYSVRGAIEAIMSPSVACQFNMSGRNRSCKDPTAPPQIKKIAFNRMDNIIDCIVHAYRGRPFDSPDIERRYGGTPESRTLWIIKSISSILIGAPDAKGQLRHVTKVTKARRIAKAVTRKGKGKGKSSAAAGKAEEMVNLEEEGGEEEEGEEQQPKTSSMRKKRRKHLADLEQQIEHELQEQQQQQPKTNSSRKNRRKHASSAAAGKAEDLPRVEEEMVNLDREEGEEEEEEQQQQPKTNSSRKNRRQSTSSSVSSQLADLEQQIEHELKQLNVEVEEEEDDEEEEEEEKKQQDNDGEEKSDSHDNGQGDGSESPSQALVAHF
jgi:hypothetical protein